MVRRGSGLGNAAPFLMVARRQPGSFLGADGGGTSCGNKHYLSRVGGRILDDDVSNVGDGKQRRYDRSQRGGGRVNKPAM